MNNNCRKGGRNTPPDLSTRPPNPAPQPITPTTQEVYVVARWYKAKKEKKWMIIGVYDNKSLAENICQDASFCVMPFEMNDTLKLDKINSIGYYPKQVPSQWLEI